MTTLVTGCAGFIGYHLCQALLAQGELVIGVDNLNNYYDVSLKNDRLAQLIKHTNFTFYRFNIALKSDFEQLNEDPSDIHQIIHLAAQAGVRYSHINPHAYAEANLVGHLNILELARQLPELKHLVYASSSSVYGANQKLPFSVRDPVDSPISLYAASKRSGELMSQTYSHLYQIPTTGLRFFTVYGPWGRPDMSAHLFTKAIVEGTPISVFNHGDMRRNFTYIDDIVKGVLGCLNRPPVGQVPHRLYNIGNNRSEALMDYIGILENLLGKKAELRFEGMQPGDVKDTIADIEETMHDFGFEPTVNIEEGLKHFVDWYRSYYGV